MQPQDERFIERMGQLYQSDALPRIAGRMFALLLLSSEPLSLDDVADKLQVSRASVSANARLLETIGMIERVTKPGDRRDYYASTQDTHQRVLEMRLRKLVQMREALIEGLESESANDAEVHERLESFCAFFDHLIKSMAQIRDSWNRASGSAVTGAHEEVG